MLHRVDRLIRSYHAVVLVFAVGYGIYAGFQSTFLVQRMRAAGHEGELPIFGDVLLIVLAAMLFETVMAPLGGYFADRFGRVRAFVAATLLMASCALVYAFAGSGFAATLGPKWLIGMAVGAELAMAAGYSLRSGALEAWITDALDQFGFSHLRARVYARQWQLFSLGITLGGAFALYYAGLHNDIESRRVARAFGYVPWLASAGLLILAGTFAAGAMESLDAGGRTRRTAESFGTAIRTVLSWPDARRVLALAALLYASFLLFMYLHPLLSRNAPLPPEDRKFLEDYYFLFFVLLGAMRVVGPTFAAWLRDRVAPYVLLQRLGLGHGAAMLAAGLLGLYASRAPSNGSVGATIVALYIAKFLEEAIKPIRSEAINAIVADSGRRALVLSLVTPGGAFLVFLLAAGVQIARPWLPDTDLWTLSSLSFGAAGVLIVLTTYVLESAQGTRTVPEAADAA